MLVLFEVPDNRLRGREAKAWTIKNGLIATEAAGIIHTDMDRGFIKAEVYAYDDLTQYKY